MVSKKLKFLIVILLIILLTLNFCIVKAMNLSPNDNSIKDSSEDLYITNSHVNNLDENGEAITSINDVEYSQMKSEKLSLVTKLPTIRLVIIIIIAVITVAIVFVVTIIVLKKDEKGGDK